MSEERLTPEERAVIAAAEKWRELAVSGFPTGDLADAVDALRESRKRWRVSKYTSAVVVGPNNMTIHVYSSGIDDQHGAARVCDLLNAADKEQP